MLQIIYDNGPRPRESNRLERLVQRTLMNCNYKKEHDSSYIRLRKRLNSIK